jgi:hypothetical protein
VSQTLSITDIKRQALQRLLKNFWEISKCGKWASRKVAQRRIQPLWTFFGDATLAAGRLGLQVIEAAVPYTRSSPSSPMARPRSDGAELLASLRRRVGDLIGLDVKRIYLFC